MFGVEQAGVGVGVFFLPWRPGSEARGGGCVYTGLGLWWGHPGLAAAQFLGSAAGEPELRPGGGSHLGEQGAVSTPAQGGTCGPQTQAAARRLWRRSGSAESAIVN